MTMYSTNSKQSWQSCFEVINGSPGRQLLINGAGQPTCRMMAAPPVGSSNTTSFFASQVIA